MATLLPTGPAAATAPDDRRAALALSLAAGVGPVRWRALLARHGGAARGALAEGLPDVRAREAALVTADRTLARAAAGGLALAMPGELAYPEALLDLADAPPALWWAGDLGALGRGPLVAVVGTRRPTSYGVRCSRAIAAALARAGAVVVSGMALGVDGEAHAAALDAGGTSVAVLGTGADVAYPAAHAPLHARLVADGAVLSEAAPAAGVTAGAFPRRNRLIAALARLTVVVEAGARSGALITAACAAELGRAVAALPGPIDQPGAAGSNLLIRDGAQVVTTVDDVLALAGCAPPSPPPDESTTLPAGLGPDERALWEALVRPAGGADVLVARTGLPAARCIAALTALELAGLVEARWGGELVRR